MEPYKKINPRSAIRGFKSDINKFIARLIMPTKRKNFKQEEERRHPDSPDGLVYIASCNPDYGKRFAETFRQQQERVKSNGQR